MWNKEDGGGEEKGEGGGKAGVGLRGSVQGLRFEVLGFGGAHPYHLNILDGQVVSQPYFYRVVC